MLEAMAECPSCCKLKILYFSINSVTFFKFQSVKSLLVRKPQEL